MLNDFFTPLVLEIDIDVGRLIARFGDEALEHHRNHVGRSFGDAQRIADDGIGRTAASLTENPLGSCEDDDIMHGQKVARIVEVSDDRQLPFDHCPDLERHAIRIAARQSVFGELTKAFVRRHAARDFVGILIFQFIEREGAGRRNLPGVRNR